MIYNEETYYIDDCLDHLIVAIKHSEIYKEYQEARRYLNAPRVQEAIAVLDDAKRKYERVERFESYLKEARVYKKEMLKAKRQLDMLPEVSHYRQCKTALQRLLDDVLKQFVHEIDDDIMIEWGQPLYQDGKKGACHGH